jgi:hypothetical protein
MSRQPVSCSKVLDATRRDAAYRVIREVYQQEKGWVHKVEAEIPDDISELDHVSWFVASVGSEPAGAIRLWYDFPIDLPEEFDVHFEREIDMEAARSCRFVEVGRFMIVPRYRRRIRVAMELMKSAVREVVERGYTHFITDVYDGDPHSPMLFHTRVLGFERIGTHRFGELDCDCTRIILILDLARAYRRAKERKNKVFRELTRGFREAFEKLPVTTSL